MPELTRQFFYHCKSAEYWEIKVKGSKGDEYIVRWDNKHSQNLHVQFDWSCTCKGYKFGRGRYCRHIKQVKDQRCGWHQFADGGFPDMVDGKKCCPKCKEEVLGQMHGV